MRRRVTGVSWSLACLLALASLSSAEAEGGVRRYALIIGNNTGAPDEAQLRFAETDARKVHRVLRDLGGFHQEDTVVLLGDTAASVKRALRSLTERLASSKQEALLLVYYSGHADAQSLHLGSSSLPLRELDRAVRTTQAKVRLLILDACRSGSLTRVKGGRRRPGFKITVDQPLASSGTVFLTASAASEDAQESDRLRGSFFTHYLVSGLMGSADANGDGDIVLEEAYRHAYENTLKESSRTLAGTQHPTFRYDLRGRGKVVLTHPGRARSHGTLRFPGGRSYLIIENHPGGQVVAEVGLWDRVRTVAVRPGRYFIRGRGRSAMLEGTVSVRARQRLAVKQSQLSRIAYARLVRKGSGDKTLSHGVVAGYRFRTALPNAESLCHGGFAGYLLTLEYFSVGARVGFCRSGYSQPKLEATVDETDLELRVSHLWDFPYFTAELGVAAGGGLLRQSFDTAHVAPSRSSFAGQLGVIVGLSADLPAGLALVVDLTVQTYFFKHHETNADADADAEVIGAFFALRPTFGLAKHW